MLMARTILTNVIMFIISLWMFAHIWKMVDKMYPFLKNIHDNEMSRRDFAEWLVDGPYIMGWHAPKWRV